MGCASPGRKGLERSRRADRDIAAEGGGIGNECRDENVRPPSREKASSCFEPSSVQGQTQMPLPPRPNGTPYMAATRSRLELLGSMAIDGSNASPPAAGGRIVVVVTIEVSAPRQPSAAVVAVSSASAITRVQWEECQFTQSRSERQDRGLDGNRIIASPLSSEELPNGPNDTLPANQVRTTPVGLLLLPASAAVDGVAESWSRNP